MKQVSKVFTCTLILSSLLICFSCNKEVIHTVGHNLFNVDAGADQTIIIPTDSAVLSGSAITNISS
ncbi:MAG: hypothetical protein ACMG51_07270, partial [Ginsengibacter sp.]